MLRLQLTARLTILRTLHPTRLQLTNHLTFTHTRNMNLLTINHLTSINSRNMNPHTTNHLTVTNTRNTIDRVVFRNNLSSLKHTCCPSHHRYCFMYRHRFTTRETNTRKKYSTAHIADDERCGNIKILHGLCRLFRGV